MNSSEYIERAYDVGADYLGLAEEQAEWSQATFGTDAERGPIGPLKHLEKEAREAREKPDDPTEYADCLLLILDAARRAGVGAVQLLEAARAKMVVNKTRAWPRPTSDEPVEHVRDQDDPVASRLHEGEQ